MLLALYIIVSYYTKSLFLHIKRNLQRDEQAVARPFKINAVHMRHLYM